MKRHESLEPLSTDHDHGLVLCSNIRKGLINNIETMRIKEYADWFKIKYLDPHFKIEEKYIFPVLGRHNVRVKKALANHRRLNRLFNETDDVELALNRLEEELDCFIRFEERTLYNEIQMAASPQKLSEVEKYHNSTNFPDESWNDPFWI